MLRFWKAIEIRVFCANLVGRNKLLWCIKKIIKPNLNNFRIVVWKMNLVKNQNFLGQLGENQPINFLLQ